MPARQSKLAPDEAAEAFYGQTESSFEEQLKLLGAVDARLVEAFKRTRENYLQQQRRHHPRVN